MSCCCACYIKLSGLVMIQWKRTIGWKAVQQQCVFHVPCSLPAYPAITPHGGAMVGMKEGSLDRSLVYVPSNWLSAQPILAELVVIRFR